MTDIVAVYLCNADLDYYTAVYEDGVLKNTAYGHSDGALHFYLKENVPVAIGSYRCVSFEMTAVEAEFECLEDLLKYLETKEAKLLYQESWERMIEDLNDARIPD